MSVVLRSLSGFGSVAAACLWLAAGPTSTAVAADQNVTVQAGESFIVALPWSTNVKWTPVLTAEAAKRVEVKEPGPTPGGIGGAKLRDYNFKAVQAGEVTFTMRKVEVGTNRLLDTVEVTVKIK